MDGTDRMLRREEVESICGLSRSSIYRKMREDSFPVARKISSRAVRWSKREVLAWLAKRPRATGDSGSSA